MAFLESLKVRSKFTLSFGALVVVLVALVVFVRLRDPQAA